MNGDEIVWPSPIGNPMSKYACRRVEGSTNSCRGVSRIAPCRGDVAQQAPHDLAAAGLGQRRR
jgi:hypothetical protein